MKRPVVCKDVLGPCYWCSGIQILQRANRLAAIPVETSVVNLRHIMEGSNSHTDHSLLTSSCEASTLLRWRPLTHCRRLQTSKNETRKRVKEKTEKDWTKAIYLVELVLLAEECTLTCVLGQTKSTAGGFLVHRIFETRM